MSAVAVPEHKLGEKEVVAVKAESHNFASVAWVAAKAVPYCFLHSSSWHYLHLILPMVALEKDIAGSTFDVVAVVTKVVGKMCLAVAGPGSDMVVMVVDTVH